MLVLLLLFLSSLFLNSLILLELYLEIVLSRWIQPIDSMDGDNCDRGYFMNLEYLQGTGHKVLLMRLQKM